jgi:uncharacterized RDD family membrane protein YckC
MRFDDPKNEYNPYAAPTADHAPSYREEEPYEYVPAERITRLGARILDNLLLVASAIPMFIIILMSFRESAERVTAGGLPDGIYLKAALGSVLGPLPLMIYQWYLIATRGQTLGKKWTGIKIVKMDGSRVDFVSGVVLRNWVLALPGFIPTVGRGINSLVDLIDVLMIFGEQRRCLHDVIAGTKVVVAPIETGP